MPYFDKKNKPAAEGKEPASVSPSGKKNPEENLSSESNTINLEKLRKLLIIPKEKIASIEDKEITLILGPTGSGKSTLIKYLMGVQLAKVKVQIPGRTTPVRVIDSAREEDRNIGPKLGHSKSAETTYPEAYTINYKRENGEQVSETICDISGFGDTRSNEHEIVTYVNMKRVIGLSKNKKIKAIIVAVNLNLLFSERIEKRLQDTFSAVKQCMKQFDQGLDNLLSSGRVRVVFTKKDSLSDRSPQELLNDVEAELEGLSPIKTADGVRVEGQSQSDAQIMAAMIRDNLKTVLFSDVLDKGQFRDLLLNKISDSPGIAKDQFQFDLHKKLVFAPCEQLSGEISRRYLSQLSILKSNKHRVNEIENEIKDLERKLVEHRQ